MTMKLIQSNLQKKYKIVFFPSSDYNISAKSQRK